jgi:hypothetical protein
MFLSLTPPKSLLLPSLVACNDTFKLPPFVSSRRKRRTRRPRGGRGRGGGAKERVCTACELKEEKGYIVLTCVLLNKERSGGNFF